MVQHPVARVLQKFINLHRTQLQSYLFIYFIFNFNHTTCFSPSSGHPQVWFLQAQYTEKITVYSLGPAVESVVRLVHVARGVPRLCSQGTGLAAVLDPPVASVVPRAPSPLTPWETQRINENLLVGTFLLFQQEHRAADSDLKTEVSGDPSGRISLVFTTEQFGFINTFLSSRESCTSVCSRYCTVLAG
jgi:hypothetical protein